MKLSKLLVVSLILAILTIGAVSASDENVTEELAVSEDVTFDSSVDASSSECDGEISISSTDDVELNSNNDSSSIKEDPSIAVVMPEKVLNRPYSASMEVKCPDDLELVNLTLYFDEKEYPDFHYGGMWFDYDFVEFMGDDYGVHTWKVNFSGDGKYNPASENGTFIYTYADFQVNNDTDDPFIVVSASLPKGADGNVTFKVNGTEVYNEKFIDSDYNEDYANMWILINTRLEDFGVYDYEITYTGDENRSSYTERGMLSYDYRFDVDIDKEIGIGKSTRLVVSLPDDVEGKVDITLDNVTETVNAEAYINIDYDNLTLFNHTVTVRYYGGNYPENSKSAYVYVNEVWNYDENVFFNENAEVTLRLNEDAKGELIASEGGNTIASATFSKGFANMTLPVLKFGNHEIKLRYMGSDYDIDPVDYTLNVIQYVYVPNIMNYGEDEYIEVWYPDDAKGNVSISFYGNYDDYENGMPLIKKVIPLENAKANYSLCDMDVYDDPGYLVVVSYNGNYPDFCEEYYLRVFKPVANITCEVVPELVVGQNATFIFSLPSDATGLLNVLIQTEPIWYDGPLGDSGSAYSNDGKAAIVITPHKAGTFYLNYYYNYNGEDSKYYYSQGGFQVTVKENGNASSNETYNSTVVPQMTVPPLDNLSGEDTFEITLPGDASGTVTLTLNSHDYVFDVVGGKANVKLPELTNGDYPYVIKYSGDIKYSSYAANGTLKVNRTSETPVENQTGTNQTGGNPSGNQTSGNGSDTNSTESKIDPVIKASDLSVVYSSGSYYTITVYGTDGKLANGATVKITGKISKALTTTNGIAKFKIDQVPGTYKITITALGKSVAKTITVKHLVTLKTATVKKSAKKLVLQATLGKINAKYLKNKKVTFKFNGKKYTAKTNKKGVAKVTVKSSVLKKLKVGKKVTYQATYLKDTVKKTAKIKK